MKNIECEHKGFLVTGIPDHLHASYADDRFHFLGKKKKNHLESSSVNDGQNECVFRQICEGICHYVFISVKSVPDNASWKICEVEFK